MTAVLTPPVSNASVNRYSTKQEKDASFRTERIMTRGQMHFDYLFCRRKKLEQNHVNFYIHTLALNRKLKTS